MSELHDLLDVMCERALAADEAARLETLVRGDQQAMRLYFAYLQLDAALRFEHGAGAAAIAQGSGENSKLETRNSNLRLRRTAVAGSSASSFEFRVSSFAVAAAFVFGIGVALWFVLSEPRTLNPEPSATAPAVALLTGANAVTWGASMAQTTLGSELSPGTLNLTTGSVQLMFRSGAVVSLQGSCEFELTGEGKGFLRRGLLHAYVPPRARGFCIAAPGGVSVTDLGTEFTMRVDAAEQSSVQVFDGMVLLETAGDSTSRTFTAGQAARVVAGRIQTAAIDELALPRVVFAAGIEWSPAFDVIGVESIDQRGELVEAITAGGAKPVNVPAGDASVTFEPRRVFNGVFTEMLPAASQASPLAQVLRTCSIGQGSVDRIELTNLIIGQRYQVQMFYADERTTLEPATMTITDSDDGAPGVVLRSRGAGGLGQSAVGRFVAAGSTCVLNVEATAGRRNAHISAWVLRRLDEKPDTVKT